MAAPTSTRARYTGHSSPSLMSMRTALAASPLAASSTRFNFGMVSGRPKPRAASRAMPSTDRQSARFGVMDTSMTSRSRPRASVRGWPGLNSGGRTMMPACSSDRPSSRSEQIMPRDSTPRSLARLISMPPGMVVPMSATGTFWPWATLGAPQTMGKSSGPPTSTAQTERWSDSGCWERSTTCPTTMEAMASNGSRMASTSRPCMVRRSARSCTVPV